MNVEEVKSVIKTIKLKGKEYPVEFSMNTFADLEIKYGSIDAAMQALEKGSIVAVRFMLSLGLSEHDPTMTETVVGKLISIPEIPVLVEQLGTLLNEDLPNKELDKDSPNV